MSGTESPDSLPHNGTVTKLESGTTSHKIGSDSTDHVEHCQGASANEKKRKRPSEEDEEERKKLKTSGEATVIVE